MNQSEITNNTRKQKRVYTCKNCGLPGHNKTTCTNQKKLQPPIKEIQDLKKQLNIALHSLKAVNKTLLKKKSKCCICFEDCEFKTSCGHSYCILCIKQWCETFITKTKHPHCPSCRQKLISFDLKKLKINKNLFNRTNNWIKIYSSEMQKYFYVNKTNGESRWIIPTL